MEDAVRGWVGEGWGVVGGEEWKDKMQCITTMSPGGTRKSRLCSFGGDGQLF